MSLIGRSKVSRLRKTRDTFNTPFEIIGETVIQRIFVSNQVHPFLEVLYVVTDKLKRATKGVKYPSFPNSIQGNLLLS